MKQTIKQRRAMAHAREYRKYQNMKVRAVGYHARTPNCSEQTSGVMAFRTPINHHDARRSAFGKVRALQEKPAPAPLMVTTTPCPRYVPVSLFRMWWYLRGSKLTNPCRRKA